MKTFNHQAATSLLTIGKDVFESDLLKLEMSIVSTAKQLIKSFCKTYWLKVVVICQKAFSQFLQTLFFYEEIPEEFLGKTAVGGFFTTTVWTFPSPSIE